MSIVCLVMLQKLTCTIKHTSVCLYLNRGNLTCRCDVIDSRQPYKYEGPPKIELQLRHIGFAFSSSFMQSLWVWPVVLWTGQKLECHIKVKLLAFKSAEVFLHISLLFFISWCKTLTGKPIWMQSYFQEMSKIIINLYVIPASFPIGLFHNWELLMC